MRVHHCLETHLSLRRGFAGMRRRICVRMSMLEATASAAAMPSSPASLFFMVKAKGEGESAGVYGYIKPWLSKWTVCTCKYLIVDFL